MLEEEKSRILEQLAACDPGKRSLIERMLEEEEAVVFFSNPRGEEGNVRWCGFAKGYQIAGFLITKIYGVNHNNNEVLMNILMGMMGNKEEVPQNSIETQVPSPVDTKSLSKQKEIADLEQKLAKLKLEDNPLQ